MSQLLRAPGGLFVPAVLSTLLCAAPVAAASEPGSPWPMVRSGPMAVGYRTVDVVDYARPTAPPKDGTIEAASNFRIVRVSIWYPAAVDSSRTPMAYRDYVEAAGFETLIGGKLVTGAEAWVGHSLFGDADEALLRATLDDPTTAYRDAPPLHGRFPTIVYAPSFSYEPFENAALIEMLVSHGYVVASSRSSGPETREMSHDQAGLEASVRDLELIVNALHDFGHADLSRLGAAGFSWGALSAPMLAMRNLNVRAVLALDGSLEHAELPSTRDRHDWDPRRLRGGYLAIVGDREPADSIAGEALYADVFELRFPGLEHWHFASDFIRINVWSAAEPDPERRGLVDDAYGIIAGRALLLFDAYLKKDEQARAVLLEGNLRAHNMAIVIDNRTARAALPAPPTPAELAELLREDVEGAREVLAAARANDPELVLLDWQQMQDIVTTSPFETKLELLALMKAELGESSIYFNNLGQAWRLEGDPERAVRFFRKALEHSPESGFARRSIAELEAE